jgi:hypothetical protein
MTHIKQKSNVKALDFLFGITPSLLEGLCQIKRQKKAIADFGCLFAGAGFYPGSTLVNPFLTYLRIN